jgi:hypothetical protein
MTRTKRFNTELVMPRCETERSEDEPRSILEEQTSW